MEWGFCKYLATFSICILFFRSLYSSKVGHQRIKIQIGRVKVSPSQLEWMAISPFDHRISLEFLVNDRDIRNIHRPRIRVQPIDQEQLLYEEMVTWARHHQIQVKGW